MTYNYQVTGMTCSSCEAKVKEAIGSLLGIDKVEVSRVNRTASITSSAIMSVDDLQFALGGKDSKYQISDLIRSVPSTEEPTRTWLETYRPILLVFGYITITTLLIQVGREHFDRMLWMRHFMAGFFLVFSFFKFLNLKGFAESYRMYDVLARQVPIWSYIYVFVELGLGIANLIDYNPILTNTITLVVMSISIIGVLQSVLNKKKIKCACLGALFNLPMSTVTIIEDGIMIAMSAAMLYIMY